MTVNLTYRPMPYSTPTDDGHAPRLGARFVKAWSDALSGDDGYGWIERVLAANGNGQHWQAVSSWGRDGFDMGDWPLVVYALGHVTETEADRLAPWRVLERIEGDVRLWAFETRHEALRALDALAAYWWRQSPGRHGEAMTAIVDEVPSGSLPIRFRGPFAWSRLREYDETGADPYEADEVPEHAHQTHADPALDNGRCVVCGLAAPSRGGAE